MLYWRAPVYGHRTVELPEVVEITDNLMVDAVEVLWGPELTVVDKVSRQVS
jgi:hypothetical protein